MLPWTVADGLKNRVQFKTGLVKDDKISGDFGEKNTKVPRFKILEGGLELILNELQMVPEGQLCPVFGVLIL